MNMPRAHSVADADRDVRQYLIHIAASLGEALGDSLAGLYVHGSLATGSFHRDQSGIDLLAVCGHALSPGQRESVARILVRLSDARPTFADIEMIIVQERYARAFEHPMPYEVAYTHSHHEAIRRSRIDYSQNPMSVDLAARIVETRARGVTLVGPPAQRLFAPIPWYAYVNALELNFIAARERIDRAPVYAVLSACRILNAVTSSGIVTLNKDEAATWALSTVPATYHCAVNDARQLYRGTKTTDDVVFLSRDITAFYEYVRERCEAAFLRARDTDDDPR